MGLPQLGPWWPRPALHQCKVVRDLYACLPPMLVRAQLLWNRVGEGGGDPEELQPALEVLLQDTFVSFVLSSAQSRGL